jgi:hypothetical protein
VRSTAHPSASLRQFILNLGLSAGYLGGRFKARPVVSFSNFFIDLRHLFIFNRRHSEVENQLLPVESNYVL